MLILCNDEPHDKNFIQLNEMVNIILLKNKFWLQLFYNEEADVVLKMK